MYCNWKLVDSQPTFNCLQWSVNWLMVDHGLIKGIYQGYLLTLNHRYLNYAQSRLSRIYQVLCEYACAWVLCEQIVVHSVGWRDGSLKTTTMSTLQSNFQSNQKKSCTLLVLKEIHTHSTEEKKAWYGDWNKISWIHMSGEKKFWCMKGLNNKFETVPNHSPP